MYELFLLKDFCPIYDLSLNVKQLFSRLFPHFLSCLEDEDKINIQYFKYFGSLLEWCTADSINV